MVEGISGSPTIAGFSLRKIPLSRDQYFRDLAPASRYDPAHAGYYRDIGIDNIGCVQTTASPTSRITTSSCACLNSHNAEAYRTRNRSGKYHRVPIQSPQRGGVGRFRQFLALHTYALG